MTFSFELFRQILHQFDVEIIQCSFISLLVIMITKLFFDRWIHTKTALVILKWLLISSAFLRLLFLIIELVCGYLGPDYVSYVTPTSSIGAYATIYWLLMVSELLLPYILLVKRTGNNVYMVFLVSLLMNIGWLFQLFVIHVTQMKREYSIDKDLNFPTSGELIRIAQGIAIGLILLIVGNILDRKRS
ncbi:hypothetical protein A0256_15560 [Mucilaginibacter sp. PAMC 26640]|nr:hypothetical protein A0256_15560 [Mucilaginibacter sp. PAMC 26640]